MAQNFVEFEITVNNPDGTSRTSRGVARHLDMDYMSDGWGGLGWRTITLSDAIFHCSKQTDAPDEPADTLGKARQLSDKAMDTITGDRQDDYGDPSVNFERVSKLWSAYLGMEVKPADVSALMALHKLSRLAKSIDHEDSWVDLIGYGALGGALANG